MPVSAVELLEPDRIENIRERSVCQRRFLYVVAVHMVKQGLIGAHNTPVVWLRSKQEPAAAAERLNAAKGRYDPHRRRVIQLCIYEPWK